MRRQWAHCEPCLASSRAQGTLPDAFAARQRELRPTPGRREAALAAAIAFAQAQSPNG